MSAELTNHLKALENESIEILREVVAEFQKPVLLYSVGKDSSVLVHLARKAFHPGPLPFPLLHVDTGYKFKEMIQFRDEFAASIGARLLVHRNEDAIAGGSAWSRERRAGSCWCAARSRFEFRSRVHPGSPGRAPGRRHRLAVAHRHGRRL